MDSSAPEFIDALKTQFDKSTDWHYIHERMKWHEQHGTRIVWILDERDEQGNSVIAIDKDKFPKLITALRTAIAENYRLNKEQSSFNDLTDAFRLSLRFFGRSK